MNKYKHEIKRLKNKIKSLENKLKPLMKIGHIYECCVEYNNTKYYYIGKWVNFRRRICEH